MTLSAEDRIAIADLVIAYAAALDSKDFGRLRPLFADGALLDYSVFDGPVGSVDEAVAWLEGALSTFDLVRHQISNHVVEEDGEGGAKGSCYLFNPMRSGESLMFVGGRYQDRYVRDAGGTWKFATRRALLDWHRSV